MNLGNSMSKLNVLQILPSLVSGGVETGTLDIASALVQQGHRAIIVSSGGPLVEPLEQLGAEHIQLPVHTKNPFLIWKNAKRLAHLIKSLNINIVHARSRAPAWSAYWATKRTNTTFITTFHGMYGHQNALKKWYNHVMLRGDMTIAVSDFIEQHIKQTYPCYPAAIKTIYRGIDTQRFDPNMVSLGECALIKKQWGVDQNKPIIMLPGRLTRLKGHEVFIRAIAKLNRNDIICLIVGDEPGKDHYRNELLALIKQLKLSSTIKLVGDCRHMPAAYKLSDIVISASTKPEAFGRVSCEAQLMNCLVIATKHGGSLETISPKLRPLMCLANDIDSMANSIKQALNLSLEEKSQTLKLAQSFINENFTLEKMCRDTLDVYELECHSANV
jgi:glycosyltransferase involved in cell wall biosynthesis